LNLDRVTPTSPYRVLRLVTAVAAALATASCSSLGYYARLAHGECALLAKREPIEKVLADPATGSTLRRRLQLALDARRFASDTLRLPRNGSYTLYADLDRPYAVWNVFAAPEFSLKPVEHCFPIAGCVGYRGYFDRDEARAEAARLQTRGLETYVKGITAYSTLGWFDDPILNTMLRWDDDELDGTIFHELAHQKFYVKGDTAFDESFATFVEREGLRQWRTARGLPAADEAESLREDQFTQLVLDTRGRLETLYASDLPPAEMRARKQAEIARLRAEYRRLRNTQWQSYSGYDAWMDSDINNAKLVPFGLYNRWVPAFAALFARVHGDWPAFYAEVKKIGDRDKDAREGMLTQLAAPAS
jgi:predicted aminopeptidase